MEPGKETDDLITMTTTSTDDWEIDNRPPPSLTLSHSHTLFLSHSNRHTLYLVQFYRKSRRKYAVELEEQGEERRKIDLVFSAKTTQTFDDV